MNRHPLDRTALVFGAIFTAIALATGLGRINGIAFSDGTLFGIAAITVGAIVLGITGWQAIMGEPDADPDAGDAVGSGSDDLGQ
ncbi:MAG: hypothetical protein HKN26_05895 [Acidimicrobiales bacterium]|nr:hypothetical protein [Acidimicrobiales bacterium]